jgi:hypothetical protein
MINVYNFCYKGLVKVLQMAAADITEQYVFWQLQMPYLKLVVLA